MICQNEQGFAKFLEFAKKELAKTNTKLTLKNSTKLKHPEGGYCAGWYTSEEIRVAKNHHLSDHTLVHEFSHYIQDSTQTKAWMNFEDHEDIFLRFTEKDFGIKDFDLLYRTILMERECERIALKFSKRFGLFDNEFYARQANVYLFFYHYCFLERKWVNSTTIYIDRLINAMPPKLLPPSAFKKIDMDLMSLYDDVLG